MEKNVISFQNVCGQALKECFVVLAWQPESLPKKKELQ